MATVTTLAKVIGGKGNPSRKPYLVDIEIDLAAAATAKGSALAASDVIQAISVSGDTAVLFAGTEIVTASAGGTTSTFDLGITGGDVDAFVDGGAITGAAAGAYSAMANTAVPIVLGAEGTIDMLLLGTTPATSGVIRVYALLMEVSNLGPRGTGEVTRDTLA